MLVLGLLVQADTCPLSVKPSWVRNRTSNPNAVSLFLLSKAFPTHEEKDKGQPGDRLAFSPKDQVPSS